MKITLRDIINKAKYQSFQKYLDTPIYVVLDNELNTINKCSYNFNLCTPSNGIYKHFEYRIHKEDLGKAIILIG